MINVFSIAMELERKEYIGVADYERTDNRPVYANGWKKQLQCALGTLTFSVPKAANRGNKPIFPASIERGKRRALFIDSAVRMMYLRGYGQERIRMT